MKKLPTIISIALLIVAAVSVNSYGFESILRYLGMGYGQGYHAGGRHQMPTQECQPYQVYPNVHTSPGSNYAPEVIHPVPVKSSSYRQSSVITPQIQKPTETNSQKNPRIERFPPLP